MSNNKYNQIAADVKAKADIVEIIGEQIALHKYGATYKGCCPFHNEKTPSFVVSPSKNSYHCYGCHKGGDVIEFVKENDKISFVQALRQLANRYHVDFPERELTEQEKQTISEKETEYNHAAKQLMYFQSEIKKHNTVAEFLDNRHITKESIEKFKIGFSVCDTDKFFINRIIYPILDVTGRTLGFTGRVLQNKNKQLIDVNGNVLENQNWAKFQNSRESIIFKKSECLFGLYQAIKAIKQKNCVYLVEGQHDVISMHQIGYENTVCSSGTAFSLKQILLLKRYTRNIILFRDNDNAGIKAVIREINEFIGEDINLKILLAPDGLDPDDFVNKVPIGKVKAYLDNEAVNFILFKSQLYAKEIETDPVKRGELITEITKDIAKVIDKNVRNQYIRDCAEVFEINEKELNKDVRKLLITPKEEEGEFFCFAQAKETIADIKEVAILTDYEEVVNKHIDGVTNYIGINGSLISKDQIIELKNITSKVIFDEVIKDVFHEETMTLYTTVENLKRLVSFGLDVDVKEVVKKPREIEPDIDEKTGKKRKKKKGEPVETYTPDDFSVETGEFYQKETYTSFSDWYIGKLFGYMFQADNTIKGKIVDNIAEMLSYLSESIRLTKLKNIVSRFELYGFPVSMSDFKKIIKTYIEKHNKHTRRHDIETIDDGIDIPLPEQFDHTNLPPYVDKMHYIRNGYFAVRNKKQQEIYFMVRTNDDTLKKASNFAFRILGHVFDKEAKFNKRLLHLTHEIGDDSYLEILSSDLVTYERFKPELFNIGNLFWYKNMSWSYERVLEVLSKNIPIMQELRQLGHNPLGFYAFADGIFDYDTTQFYPFDKYGMVEFKGQALYCKIFSLFNKEKATWNEETTQGVSDTNKKEVDPAYLFVFDRKKSPVPLHHTEKCDFNTWAKLLKDVYPEDNSGMLGLIFIIITCFRDIYMEKLGHCPIFFLTGETNAGKSQLAESMLWTFSYKSPIFNLQTGTLAAFSESLEFACNFIFPGDEYNDIQVHDEVFASIKASYDGNARQKMSNTGSGKRIYQILTSLLILGQEMPERDDQAVLNRAMHCAIPTKVFSEEAELIYNKLKNYEHAGLSHILCAILSKRNFFLTHLKENIQLIKEQLKEKLKDKNIVMRIMNTCSEFLATAKTFMQASPELQLPFTYKELEEIIEKKAIDMSAAVTATNRISNFFDTIAYLTTQKKLMYGRDYIIINTDCTKTFKTKTGITVSLNETTPLLYIRLNQIYNLYKDVAKNEALKQMNLRNYLKSQKFYIGEADDVLFQWEEIKIVEEVSTKTDNDGNSFTMKELVNKPVPQEQKTSGMAFIYEQLNVDLLPAERRNLNGPEDMPF